MIRSDYLRGEKGPKSPLVSKGLALALPESFIKDPDKPRCVLYVGHGIGERGKGTKAALDKIFNWGYFSQILAAVDEHDFIVCFLNAEWDYDKGEHEAALDFVEANFAVIPEMNAYFGHSLGSFGFGTFVLPILKLLKRFRFWFCSASGMFPGPYKIDLAQCWDNLIAAGLIVVGITAENDTKNRTNPVAVTRIYDEMKRRDQNAKVILIEFPDTAFEAAASHNAVCGRLADSRRIQADGAQIKGIKGKLQMSIYEFWLSNPPGAPFKTPDQVFTGEVPVKVEESKPMPAPTPPTSKKEVVYHNIYLTKGTLKVQRVYNTGEIEVLDIDTKNANNLYVRGELHGTLSGPKGTTPKNI